MLGILSNSLGFLLFNVSASNHQHRLGQQPGGITESLENHHPPQVITVPV